MQQDYLQQMGTLWFNTMMQTAAESIQPAKGDRRFVSEDWQKSPFHDFLKQSYLINARYVNGLIDRAAGLASLRVKSSMRLAPRITSPVIRNHCGSQWKRAVKALRPESGT